MEPYLVQSLLQAEGLDSGAYRERFGTDVGDDFAHEVPELHDRGFLEGAGTRSRLRTRLRLTDEGPAWSDAIGPRFFSAAVRERMHAYEAK